MEGRLIEYEELCALENGIVGPALTTTYINVPIGYTSMLVAQSPGSM